MNEREPSVPSYTAMATTAFIASVGFVGIVAFHIGIAYSHPSSEQVTGTVNTERLERMIEQRINTELERNRLVGPEFRELFAEAVADYSATQRSAAVREKQAEASHASVNLRPVTENDWIMGTLDAPVVLVEYGSYACGFCQRAHSVFHDLMEQYDGQLAWVYRHFPLGIGGNDEQQAVAANCVGELGGNNAFWAFSDALYENAIYDNRTILTFLNQWDISPSAMDECTSNPGTMVESIRDHAAAGRAAGVTGTPGNFLLGPNGEIVPMPGAQPHTEFERVIDRLLSNV